MSPYPEHEKLKAENYKTQIIHDFLEALAEEERIVLCKEYKDGFRTPISIKERDDLMAAFIGVDRDKLEDEKRAMLEECRKLNEK